METDAEGRRDEEEVIIWISNPNCVTGIKRRTKGQVGRRIVFVLVCVAKKGWSEAGAREY